MKRRWMAFVYAWKGLRYAFRTQPNFRIHIAAVLLVNAAGLCFKIQAREWILIWICITMVLAAELINTALEMLTDKLWPERNPKAGHIKDLAAAAVLVCALVSLATAAVIFVPYIRSALHG